MYWYSLLLRRGPITYHVLIFHITENSQKNPMYMVKLGGGFKYLLFSPRILGEDEPIWRAYFSTGLVQPPTSETIRPFKRSPSQILVLNSSIEIIFPVAAPWHWLLRTGAMERSCFFTTRMLFKKHGIPGICIFFLRVIVADYFIWCSP